MPASEPAPSDEEIERRVLSLVASVEQLPWSAGEVARKLGDGSNRVAIEDALTHLRAAGLLNQADGLYFASQAAAYADRLGMLML